MSQDNVELTRRGIEAFNRLCADVIIELATPDFEWYPAMPVAVTGGVYKGREGIEAYFQDIRDTWEELRISAEEFRDLGDRVLVLGRLEGRGIGSGVEVNAPLGIVFELRGDKACSARGYFDRGDALRAAGLDE
jgi:ketosteroid isomerase-like protein